MTRGVLLLRAVNVSGRNRVPMAELREILAGQRQLGEVSTYIASGNIICDLAADPAETCEIVRRTLSDAFGVETPVIARSHDELVESLAALPFGDGQEKFVHAMFLASEPVAGGVDALRPRLSADERVELVGKDLWIDYASGVQNTKLTTAVFDRALGVAGTARNLRTVRALVERTG